MKQTLELRVSQRLTMTPQLQHAIRLLQLSAVDLRTEIQEALDNNPLLDEPEDDGSETIPDLEFRSDSEQENNATEKQEAQDASEIDLELDRDELLPESVSEADWQEEFDISIASNVRNFNDDSAFELDVRSSAPTTLRDHLSWQLRLMPMSPYDQSIAITIIDAVNEDGYLACDLEEIRGVLDNEVEENEILAVLHQIQNFDPVGVAARNLRECLLVQLRQLDDSTPNISLARQVVQHHLELLAKHDMPQLGRQLKATPENLRQAVLLIRSLHPRPGSTLQPSQTSYIIPDIIVKKVRNQWRAELNPKAFPEVRVNKRYQELIQRNGNSRERKYLREHVQEARWFIKSLKNRSETLLQVAREIVYAQRDFFEQGEEAMKPMVLHDIAEILSLHESTISRATTQKYMMTPRGIFELKYFFSSHVSTADGGTCSATAIRSLIKKLVENEPPMQPMSDSKIVKSLEEKGIRVARRTIAKYRECMNIPPSNQRKSLV